MSEEKLESVQQGLEAKRQELSSQQDQQEKHPSLVDEQGRRVYDDNGEKIHWATPAQRVIAFVLALVVVGITLAMAYSIAVGDFFRW